MINGNSKCILYYYARYFGYGIAYGLLWGLLLLWPVILAISLLIGWLQPEGWPLYITIVLLVIWTIFVILKAGKDTFKKVYFKPYKRFKIVPKFEKVTYWFVAKFTLMNWFLGIIASLVLTFFLIKLGMRPLEEIIMARIMHTYSFESRDLLWILGLIGGLIVNIFVVKYFVEKYATIEKIEK